MTGFLQLREYRRLSKTWIKVKNPKALAATRAIDGTSRVLLITVHILGAPRIRIVGQMVGGRSYLLFAGVFGVGGPPRIVKLIDHAKSAHAARGCPTLLNGEEAAIGGG